MDRRDLLVLSALLLAGCALPAILSVIAGIELLPRNDDWSYRGLVDHLYRVGDLRLDGASQSSAVGQILVTLPLYAALGGDPVTFWLVGTASTGLAITFAYILGRLFLPVGPAVLVTISLMVIPGYLAYATSFQTDGPALAAQLACLAAGVLALRDGRGAMAAGLAAAAAGLLAYSIRQFALAAPASLLVACAMTSARRWLGLITLLVAGLIVLTVWMSSLAGQVGATPRVPGGSWRAAATVMSMALMLLPVVLLSLGRRRAAGSWATLGAGLTLGLLVIASSLLSGGGPGTLENLFSRWGVPASEYIVGGRPELIPVRLWYVLQGVAFISVVLLGDALARTVIQLRPTLWRWTGRRWMGRPDLGFLVIFIGLTTVGLLGFSMLFLTFDRYVWPVIVPLAVVLLYDPGTVPGQGDPAGLKSSRLAAALTTLVFAGIAVAFALNSAAFDRGRWDAGRALVDAGYEASEVDAGYEWVGTFAPGPAHFADRQIRPQDPLIWYGNIWPEWTRCAMAAGRPMDLPAAAADAPTSTTYRLYLVAGPMVPLYLYRVDGPGCAGPSAE